MQLWTSDTQSSCLRRTIIMRKPVHIHLQYCISLIDFFFGWKGVKKTYYTKGFPSRVAKDLTFVPRSSGSSGRHTLSTNSHFQSIQGKMVRKKNCIEDGFSSSQGTFDGRVFRFRHYYNTHVTNYGRNPFIGRTEGNQMYFLQAVIENVVTQIHWGPSRNRHWWNAIGRLKKFFMYYT